MTGRWNKHKTKKPLETSLGQAPKETEKVVDLSHLRKPITTSVFGLKQVLTLFQTATSEVQEYITYECDVLYECRVCRTIFRSLANFILHKRNYCREKFNSLGGANPESTGGFVVSEKEEVKSSHLEEEQKASVPEQNEEKNGGNENVTASSPPEPSTTDEQKKKNIMPIIDKLIKRQEINILAKNTLNEDLSAKADNSDDDVVFVGEETNVMLQKIDTSDVAVFQTAVKDPVDAVKSGLIKSEVMEIHGILDSNEVILDSNGKVSTNKKSFRPNIPKQDLVCTECNFTFSTEKTLTHHIKYKHNKTCIVYPCPDCKETFANAWSVYRHLYKVHRRTSTQVRRMRAQIHSSGIRKDQEPERKKDKSHAAMRRENEENQWMNNFERDKDLQMCGGCGKRFERKAALHSHSQMCTKRIAVCNTIKENDLKMKAAEKKVLEEKVAKSNGVKVVKGAAKRKPAYVQKGQESAPHAEEGQKKVEDADGESVEVKKDDIEEQQQQEQQQQQEKCVETQRKRNNLHHARSIIKLGHSIDLSSASLIRIKERNERKRMEAMKKLKSAQMSNGNKEEKVSQVIVDSDDEKENSVRTVPESKEIKVEADVVITKYKDTHEEEKPQELVPEIEIFTISDDSSSESQNVECNGVQDRVPTPIPTPVPTPVSTPVPTCVSTPKPEEDFVSTPKPEEDPDEDRTRHQLKRKRSPSWDVDRPANFGDDYKEYLNDDLDQCFFSKAAPFVDRDLLKCIPCQTTYMSQYQLLQHMSLHFSWFRYQCSKCSFMSFYMYDCTTHAYTNHGTPTNLIGSTVLPIPKWKVLCGAHNFLELSEEMLTNNPIKPVNMETANDECNKTMPHLEAIIEAVASAATDGAAVPLTNGDNVSENVVQTTSSEVVTLEDDDMPDICSENVQNSDAIITTDEDAKDQVKEESDVMKAGPSKSTTESGAVAKNRPVRIRTKSVKTVQNDFLYDLTKVIKLNDNSLKLGKFRKGLGKP